MTINYWIKGLPEPAVDSEPANTSHMGYWIHGLPYVSAQTTIISLLGKITVQSKGVAAPSFAALAIHGRIVTQAKVKVGPQAPAHLVGKITAQVKGKDALALPVGLHGALTVQSKLKTTLGRVAVLKSRLTVQSKLKTVAGVKAPLHGKISVMVKAKDPVHFAQLALKGLISVKTWFKGLLVDYCDLVLFGAITPDIPMTAPLTGGDVVMIGLLSGGDITMQAIMCCDD